LSIFGIVVGLEFNELRQSCDPSIMHRSPSKNRPAIFASQCGLKRSH
jgi:hypothetical protein